MGELTFEQYREMLRQIDPEKDCPVQALIGVLSKKWNLRVIFELTKHDTVRFGELKKQIGNITNASLSATLKDFEENGFVDRKQFNEIPPRVEYSLTEKGKMLYPIFAAMGNWCQAYGDVGRDGLEIQ